MLPDVILRYTKNALISLLVKVKLIRQVNENPLPISIHLPRINAGLFAVPWEDTAKILEELSEKYPVTWNVYSL